MIWHYPRVEIVRVLDGDTVEARLDLGFHTFRREILRLDGVNAPEIRGPEREAGLVAKHRLQSLIEIGPVSVTTIRDKTEKYGRYLAVLWRGEANLNQQLSHPEGSL